MPAAIASFSLVPDEPLDAEGLSAYRAELESFPVYHEPADDLYVVFGTPEERTETVALYARQTTPTFEVESFVQLRPQRMLIHPGNEPGGVAHLRNFVVWALERGGHRLVRGERTLELDDVLPANQPLA